MNALIALTLLQDPLSKVVPLDIPVGLLRPTVARLAQASGVKLSVSDAVWDTEVFVASKDLTLKEIMDAVGRINFATWERNKEGYVLVPDRNLREKIKQEQKSKFLASLTEFIAEEKANWLSGPVPAADLKVAADRYNEATKRGTYTRPSLESRSPVQKFCGRVLLQLPLSEVSDCPRDGRLVFSSHPTAMQRPLPRIDWAKEFAGLEAETRDWAKAGMPNFGARTYAQDDDDGRMRLWSEAAGTETHVIIERKADGWDDPVLRVRQYGQAGHLLLETELRLRPKAGSVPDETYQSLLATSGSYKLDVQAKKVLAILAQPFRRLLGEPLTQEEIAPYLVLGERDPFALATTPFCRAYSEKLGGNVALVVPDLVLPGLFPRKRDADAIEQPIEMGPGIYYLRRGLNAGKEVLIGRARVLTTPHPEDLPRVSVDRAPQQRLLNDVLAHQSDVRELVMSYQCGASTENFDYAIQLAAAYTGATMDSLMVNNDLVKVYWSLPKTLRDTLARGKDVVVAKGTGKAFQILQKLLYSDGGYSVVKGLEPAVEDRLSESPQYSLMNVAQEPTRSFPTPPSRFLLQARLDSREIISVSSRDANYGGGAEPMTAERAAIVAFYESQPGFYPPGYPRRDQYQTGTLTRLLFTVPLSDTLSFKAQIFLKQAFAQPKPVARKDLPKEWQQKLDEAQAKITKEYANRGQEVAPPAKP